MALAVTTVNQNTHPPISCGRQKQNDSSVGYGIIIVQCFVLRVSLLSSSRTSPWLYQPWSWGINQRVIPGLISHLRSFPTQPVRRRRKKKKHTHFPFQDCMWVFLRFVYLITGCLFKEEGFHNLEVSWRLNCDSLPLPGLCILASGGGGVEWGLVSLPLAFSGLSREGSRTLSVSSNFIDMANFLRKIIFYPLKLHFSE